MLSLVIFKTDVFVYEMMIVTMDGLKSKAPSPLVNGVIPVIASRGRQTLCLQVYSQQIESINLTESLFSS